MFRTLQGTARCNVLPATEVDCSPSKWTSLKGAEVDIVYKRCVRIGGLVRRHCGCRGQAVGAGIRSKSEAEDSSRRSTS